jgi:protein-S-isoprenylcysteine O-methyltransferase Ste14
VPRSCQRSKGARLFQPNFWRKKIKTKARLLVGFQFGILGVLFLKPSAPIILASDVLAKISNLIYILAALILFIALVNLRPSLRVSPIPITGAPLITSGIYKWLRHPMYLSVMGFATGMAAGHLTYISIALWCLLLIVLILKARLEDQLLRNIHPEAIAYQRRTTLIKRNRG